MIEPKRIGAVVLARMDSHRLPGKVLAPVSGRPLLWYVASRIPAAVLDWPAVLATSDRDVDAPLVEAAEKLGLEVFRGSSDDVAGRILAAARCFGMDGVFRINGDSPFVEAGLIERAASIFRDERPDLVTNLFPRTFPYGVSIELFDRQTLARRLEQDSDAYLREHVTACFYRDPACFRIRNIQEEGVAPNSDVTRIRLTIDEPNDLGAFRMFVERSQGDWSETSYRAALASGLFHAKGV